MNKVYVILEYDIDCVNSTIYGIYADKSIAKRMVDELNDYHEDGNIHYALESHDLIEGNYD